VVGDMHDFTCVILDAACRVVAQSTQSQPPFLGTAPGTVRAMLEEFPITDLAPGDVLITNDPWIGTGHLNDMTAISPICLGSTVLGFAVTAAHLPSIGGRVYGAEATDIFEEGLHLPPLRLYRAGVRNDDLVRIIRTNSRMPTETVGDLEAYRAAN